MSSLILVRLSPPVSPTIPPGPAHPAVLLRGAALEARTPIAAHALHERPASAQRSQPGVPVPR